MFSRNKHMAHSAQHLDSISLALAWAELKMTNFRFPRSPHWTGYTLAAASLKRRLKWLMTVSEDSQRGWHRNATNFLSIFFFFFEKLSVILSKLSRASFEIYSALEGFELIIKCNRGTIAQEMICSHKFQLKLEVNADSVLVEITEGCTTCCTMNRWN